MFNLLFLTSLAFASDVYEICVLKQQVWSDYTQSWKTESVSTFYTYPTIQFIVHDDSIEINRVKANIVSKKEIGGFECMREHENSLICHDKENGKFLWEFQYKNGKTTRDILTICGKNGK